MRVGIITQARTTSTRLPKKVLLRAGQHTFLDHHLDRLVMTGHPVIIATTSNDSDDEIAAIAERRELGVHRGSEHDVLERFHDCAAAHGLDVIVRVTSDCPLIDGNLIRSGIDRFLAEDDPDLYLSNTLVRSFPRGFDFEVFSFERLEEAHLKATEASEREHVTPYLYNGRAAGMRVEAVTSSLDRSEYRLTLDTAADQALLTELIEEFDAVRLSAGEIVEVMDNNPRLAKLNSHVAQKTL